MNRQANSRESGFTLLELLIAIALSGILMTAAVTSFITVARGTKDLHDRFLQSQDAQLLATYFPSDAQSADPNITPDTDATAGWAVCTGTAPSGTTNVLQLRWSETSGAGTTNFAAGYRTRQSGTDWQLVRYFCADTLPAIFESHPVARNLADQTIPANRPVVNTATPRLITMKLFAFSSDIGDYDYTFKGRMRTPLPAAAGPEVVSITRVGSTPTNAASVQWTVLFDKVVTGVDVGDFNLDGLSGTSITGVTPTAPSGGATTYTVTASTGSGSGALRLDLLDDNSIKDASNVALGGSVLGDGSFTSGGSYLVDRDGPTVSSIVRAGASSSSPTGTAVSWTVTFNEDVNPATVGSSDFDVVTTTGSTSTTAPVPTQVDATTFTVSTTPTGTGTIRLDLDDDDSVLDLAGNPLGGIGANDFTTGEEYTITGGGSAPTVTKVELKNGGSNDGKLEEGDSVVITFSEAMNLSSFCSGWTGPTLSVDDDLTVTVTQNGTNDVLSVATTGTACNSNAFNLGSIELNQDYVSASMSFHKGTGNNTPSTITWAAGTNQLTVSLGKKDGNGANNTVTPTSKPKYLISNQITDLDGNQVSPLSFTEPTTLSRF
jgi:prepilin-type N-terminal cleavage/methylation domain-containing protein